MTGLGVLCAALPAFLLVVFASSTSPGIAEAFWLLFEITGCPANVLHGTWQGEPTSPVCKQQRLILGLGAWEEYRGYCPEKVQRLGMAQGVGDRRKDRCGKTDVAERNRQGGAEQSRRSRRPQKQEAAGGKGRDK